MCGDHSVFGESIMRGAIVACALSLAQVHTGWAQPTRPESSLRISVEAASLPPRVLTIADLSAMQAVTFETSTIWTEGRLSFTGVPLRALLMETMAPEDLVPGAVVRVVALNQYFADIPLDALAQDVPILAFHIDGQPFPVRDKGPFWIVYPYDSAPEYMTEEVYSRSVWQVQELVLRVP